jgi:hypothetical protein
MSTGRPTPGGSHLRGRPGVAPSHLERRRAASHPREHVDVSMQIAFLRAVIASFARSWELTGWLSGMSTSATKLRPAGVESVLFLSPPSPE